MREDLVERCKILGQYIYENNATIRQAAKQFSYSKSTVHVDVSKRLKRVDGALFDKVRLVLENNFEEKHLRGGLATKIKYKNSEK
ncbi:MAG: sporulation transcriptional regulator SpoIIID [Christensenellales bacterium]